MAAVNSATVELPDVPELLRELRGLERRRGTFGKDRVDHRPGAHNDLANTVAGVVSCIAIGAGEFCPDTEAPRVCFVD